MQSLKTKTPPFSHRFNNFRVGKVGLRKKHISLEALTLRLVSQTIHLHLQLRLLKGPMAYVSYFFDFVTLVISIRDLKNFTN